MLKASSQGVPLATHHTKKSQVLSGFHNCTAVKELQIGSGEREEREEAWRFFEYAWFDILGLMHVGEWIRKHFNNFH